MKILFIHLSDLHFLETTSLSPDYLEKLASAAFSFSSISDYVYLIFSGDLTNRGKEMEFTAFSNFSISLIEQLQKKFGDIIEIISVPGNHDCDLEKSDAIREQLLSGNNTKWEEPRIRNCILTPFEAYDGFVELINPQNHETATQKNQIAQIHTSTFNDNNIKFLLVNTAWSYRKDLPQGKYFLPLNQFPIIPPKDENTLCHIAILHHPIPWFESSNGREFQKYLNSAVDFVFTGHIHDFGFKSSTDEKMHESNVFEGDVFIGDNSKFVGGFNLIKLDFATKIQVDSHYSWSEANNCFVSSTTVTKPLNSLCKHNENGFCISDKFADSFLEDPGIQLTPQNQHKVKLQDVFVLPDMRINTLNSTEQKKYKLQVGKPNVEFFLENRRAYLTGSKNIGKTALSKFLFVEFKSKGFLPLYMDGNCFKYATENSIQNTLKREYENEYSKPIFESFQQYTLEKKVLIVDNFEKLRSKISKMPSLFKVLESLFSIIIVLSNDEFHIENQLENDAITKVFEEYANCTLMPFGHTLRSELMDRWDGLGNSPNDEDRLEASDTQRMNLEKKLDYLLGKSFLPSYPMFIYSILQMLETNTSLISSNLPIGSYGFIYHNLIGTSFLRSTKPATNIDLYFNYLSDFAGTLARNNERSLSIKRAHEYHEDYCNKYKLSLSFSEVMDICQEAEIMMFDDDRYSFRYDYQYFFFYGRYLSNNYESGDVRETVRNLIENIGTQEAADTILFLCYFSKEPELINKLLDTADAMIGEINEFDILESVKFLQDNKYTSRVLVDVSDIKKNRREYHSEQDVSERRNRGDNLEKAVRMPTRLRMIEVLGQILKNYQGSMLGELKVRICKTAVALGLRCIQHIFILLEEILPAIKEATYEFENEKEPGIDKLLIESRVDAGFYSLLIAVTYGSIRFIADSIGNENLDLIYKEMQDESNLSYRLVDLAIRLESYFSAFPEDEIQYLLKIIRKHSFGYTIMQRLVAVRFYLYQTNYKIINKYSEVLGIQTDKSDRFNTRQKLLTGNL